MSKNKSKNEIQASRNKPLPDANPLDILRRIQSGEIAANVLSPDQRRDCVNHLAIRGHTTAEIARLFGYTDRTIRRDMQGIRAAYALDRDDKTIRQLVGGLVREAEISISRICSAAASEDTRIAERIDASFKCWSIRRGLVEMLQRLGYLPAASLKVSGDIDHKISFKPLSSDDVQAELTRILGIVIKYGPDDERPDLIKQLIRITQRLEITEQTDQSNPNVKEKNDEELKQQS